MEERIAAWKAAAELVEPIVSEYGLDKYNTGIPPFSSSTTVTKADQHIGHILDVANWLLSGEA